ncbi:serine hydrolase domain-containing protein [Enhygromyxa salina]|uniref:serine hydrolase domain-containing protein n=1 Tax=Enhygromyxa salina TaxID=215803 RepID=UPI000695DEE6|nr:serine hydrolase domain-containing protein [Enhygromyxa salina]
MIGLLVFGIWAIGLSATLQAAAPSGSIDDFIDSEMPASGAPGLAYAVVVNGEIVEVGARGVLELGENQEVTPDTPFLTGSISKSFTALAVMQLVEAGKINLDAELSRYLDRFSGGPSGSITIRQLLSHTSGFSTLQGNAPPAERPEQKDELARVVDQLATLAPAYPPGTTWEYSNLNYQILGRVIEVVSNQDFQTYVVSNILVPVGMKNSFVANGEVHEEMATGHLPWFGTKRPLAENRTRRSTAPQGGVVASASDLARYMQVMLNGKDDVLSASGKAAMMRPASDASPSYGFGWFLDAQSGSVWHSGASPGTETLATMVPNEQTGVVVLVNSGGGLGFGESAQLRNGITARAIGADYDGEGSRWAQKATFVAMLVLPFAYLFSILWAWRERAAIRAKSGPFGVFSLWFPLLTTLGAAGFIFVLVPKLFGVPLGTLRRFQPDFALVLSATAVTGVVWAVFRLGVAYSGKSRQA